MQICSWCCGNEEESTVFLCDTCPRVICIRCVALANGGGAKGKDVVDKLKSDDAKWSCVYCKPTLLIEKMRTWIGVTDNSEEVNNGDTDDDKEYATDHKIIDKEVNDLLLRLDDAERMKEEAEKMLERGSEEMIKNQIYQELKAGNDDDKVVEVQCQSEFDTWKQQWMDHHARYCTMIGNLMDSLGKTIFLFYVEICNLVSHSF